MATYYYRNDSMKYRRTKEREEERRAAALYTIFLCQDFAGVVSAAEAATAGTSKLVGREAAGLVIIEVKHEMFTLPCMLQ